MQWHGQLVAGLAAVAVCASLAACGSDDGSNAPSSATQEPGLQADGRVTEITGPTKKLLEFHDTAGAPAKEYRVAYLTECIANVYCQARLRGLKDAAKKFGFEFKIFDANFNPATQLRLVQDAVAEGGFDGYLFAPTAAAPSCSMWKRYLVPTKKPVVTLDLPMCGDADYTKGLAGTVTMQRQTYFNVNVNEAFKNCPKPCKALTLSGFTGSDLFNLWSNAVNTAAKANPGVKVVGTRAAQFDPQLAFRDAQDALRAHPDLKLVVSHDDAMSRAVTQAIRGAGKTPGKDVLVYSTGADERGLAEIEEGSFNRSAVLLPYEEAYYAGTALVAAMEGKPINGYVDEAELPPVTGGPKSIFITDKNAGTFKAKW